MPAAPSKLRTCGGIIEILDTDDEESVSVASAPVAPVAGAKKSRQSAKPQANRPHTAMPKVMYATLPRRAAEDDNDSWENKLQ
jgi:hypothetical protein